MNEDDTFKKLKKLSFAEARSRYHEFGKRPIDGTDIEDFWESVGWSPEEYFLRVDENLAGMTTANT